MLHASCAGLFPIGLFIFTFVMYVFGSSLSLNITLSLLYSCNTRWSGCQSYDMVLDEYIVAFFYFSFY